MPTDRDDSTTHEAEHLEALPDDVLSLLGEEKRAPVPALAEADRAALFAAISTRLGFVPPDGGGEGGGGGSGGAGGGTSTGLGGAGAGAVAPGGGFVLAGGKAVAALIATLAIGVAAGVVIDRQVASSPAPSPMAVSAVPGPSPVAPAAPKVEDSAGVPVGALPSAPRVTATQVAQAPSVSPTPSSRGLAAERALLDVARGALARGEATEALRAADRHASEYPSGALVEEREAIAIKALVALGRNDEARRRFKEMERRFPNGLMLRAVKNAVDQAP